MSPAIDHLVFAAPDLLAAVAELADRFGAAFTRGGRHPRWGTANYLLGLGPGLYFEVIGPDPERAAPSPDLPFDLAHLESGRLATWAVRTTDLDALVATSQRAGYDPGPIAAMSRDRPDGSRLSWRLAMPAGGEPGHGGLVPFLLDWGGSPHPSTTLDSRCRLRSLRAEHPEPALPLADLAALGVELEVTRGPVARLVAQIDGARGLVAIG